MTLSTNIYVLDEASPHELFRHCQTLLTKYDEERRPWNQQKCSDLPSRVFRGGEFITEPGGPWRIGNDLGQGLPAILDIDYQPGGPLRTPEQAAEHDSYCGEDCDGEYHGRACWMDIDFDTSYGYHDSEGRGCGDLHALLVAQVGEYLDARGVRWEWHNEFTGEVHGGDDRYARLVGLCSGGFEAAAWFRASVLPALARTLNAEVES